MNDGFLGSGANIKSRRLFHWNSDISTVMAMEPGGLNAIQIISMLTASVKILLSKIIPSIGVKMLKKFNLRNIMVIN
jgi:hypothetical protein